MGELFLQGSAPAPSVLRGWHGEGTATSPARSQSETRCLPDGRQRFCGIRNPGGRSQTPPGLDCPLCFGRKEDQGWLLGAAASQQEMGWGGSMGENPSEIPPQGSREVSAPRPRGSDLQEQRSGPRGAAPPAADSSWISGSLEVTLKLSKQTGPSHILAG